MVDRRFALRSMIFITDLKIDFFSMHRDVLLLLVNIYTKNKFQSEPTSIKIHDATDS